MHFIVCQSYVNKVVFKQNKTKTSSITFGQPVWKLLPFQHITRTALSCYNVLGQGASKTAKLCRIKLSGEAGSIDGEAGETFPRLKKIKWYRNLPLGSGF